MAVTTILTTDSITTWVTKTNTISTNLGDPTLVDSNLVNEILNLDSDIGTRTSLGTTDKTDVVSAINELETAIRGTSSNYTLTTAATNLVSAINEHETLINTLNDSIGSGGLNTTATTLVGAINEHETLINTLNDSIGSGGLNTTAQTLIGAVNELDSSLALLTDSNRTTILNLIDDVNELQDSIGSGGLNTTATNLVGAINEHETQINSNTTNIGTLSSLATTAKSSLVAAINEVNSAQASFNEASEIHAIFSATDAGGDGSFSYNSSTGAFTYTGPSASEVRAHFSAGEGIDISSGSISGEDASTTNKGIASFNSTRFSVSSGAVDVATGGIDTTQLASGAVTNAKLGADAVDGTKIADDAINSEHYVDGSIDAAHLASNSVTQAKLADDAVGSAELKDGVSLIIYNAAGTAVKTIYGAGS